jgi:hypothetical protein
MFDNINPSLWGPHGWKIMHYITISYPDNPTKEDKDKILKFFMAIKDVLPCENCRVHFSMNLQKYPLSDDILSCKYKLINWLKDIHNEVNIRTGKKIYTYDELIKEYSNNNNNNYNIEIVTVVLLLLIVIIILIYAKIKFFD